FRLLANRDWEVRLKHIYKEDNHLADYLAGKGHNLGLGKHSVDLSDSELQRWARYDEVRSTERRLIPIL
ncbi:hypothetical protein LINPERPRIM_LOCUS11159, partial [Linum perenne]